MGRAPLDTDRLEALAVTYVARYGTTQLRLRRYLERKLRECGWDGESSPPVDRIVARMAELGYVDDTQYAQSRARSLLQRGYGPRRVSAALRADGVEHSGGWDADTVDTEKLWLAARRFAEKRRIGPFAAEPVDDDRKRKQLQAFIRAGHDYALARAFVYARDIPDLPDAGD